MDQVDAKRLFHEGSLALSEIEANGIRIDVDYLKRTIDEVGDKIVDIIQELKKDEIYQTWRRRYGDKTKLRARQQLAEVLFNVMGMERPRSGTSMDEETLLALDLPFAKQYLRYEKLQKLKTTYLEGVLREVVDGFLHPVFNLNLARSFRSTCDSPNFQNIPVRDPEIGGYIRRAFVARGPDYYFGEGDFGGIEVKIAACYHKDPAMLAYLNDPSKDMHRDQAAKIFCFRPEEYKNKDDLKLVRYVAKNMFVFPEFYGSFYIDCARNLWEAMISLNLKSPDGRPMREWMRDAGIPKLGQLDHREKPELGTFEEHVKGIEEDFWKLFKVYAQWKQEWWQLYQERGWFEMLTGFRIEGAYKRNEVINLPVQGSAFHCLLWCLVELQKWLKKYKMKTLIIGQIHDSMAKDIWKKEREDVLYIMHKIMTQKLAKAWPWIIVPLEVEAELSPLGGSWFDKKKVELV